MTTRSAERRGGHCHVITFSCPANAWHLRRARCRMTCRSMREGGGIGSLQNGATGSTVLQGLPRGADEPDAPPSETRKIRDDRSPVRVAPESPSWPTKRDLLLARFRRVQLSSGYLSSARTRGADVSTHLAGLLWLGVSIRQNSRLSLQIH